MDDDAAALWAALGDPRPGVLLPPARAPAWISARWSLAAALRSHALHWIFRSPSALWALLKGGTMPPGSTWRDLLRDAGLSVVLDAVRDRRSNRGWKFAIWNTRWLISPHTDKAARKRAIIRRWLDSGRVVFLQETHWLPCDIAIWQNLFPGSLFWRILRWRAHVGGPVGA